MVEEAAITAVVAVVVAVFYLEHCLTAHLHTLLELEPGVRVQLFLRQEVLVQMAETQAFRVLAPI